jgi:DNA-binding Xre family transcriptional regulator
MTRQVAYRWKLREVMAMNGIYATTDLVPLLKDRDVDLSVSQVHRLVTGTPERLNLTVLAALCDILGAGVADLIETSATEVATARRVVGQSIRPARPVPRTAAQPAADAPEPGPRPVRVRLVGDDPAGSS